MTLAACAPLRLAFRVAVSMLAMFAGLMASPVSALAQEADDTPFAYSFSDEWVMGPLSGFDQWRTATIAAERLRRFPDSPHTISWLMQARRHEDAFAVMERIIDSRPEAIGAVFRADNWWNVVNDELNGYRARLTALVNRAHVAAQALDRESQASIALAMVRVDALLEPDDHERRIRRLIERFPGTRAAALAEVDLVGLPRFTPASMDAFDAIAAQDPDSEAAARALYRKARILASSSPATDPSGSSTERFLEVIRLANVLERSRLDTFDRGESPAELVLRFQHRNETASEDDRARLMDAFLAYARDHLDLLDDPRRGFVFEGWLAFTVPLLAARTTDANAADRWFDHLERTALPPATLTILRARWLTRSARTEGAPPLRATDTANARRLLARAAAGQGPIARRALVALAAQQQINDDLPGARATYADYQRRFADAPEAWMASLRIAQIDHSLGRYDEAARGFGEVSERYASVPFARVLGAIYAGRSLEAIGRFGEARARYTDGLAAWLPPVGTSLSAGWPPDVTVTDPFTIRRADVLRRSEQLARVLSMPDGDVLARAQWLLTNSKPAEAARTVHPLIDRNPRSAAAARHILHQARLDEAVALVSDDASTTDIEAALKMLGALAREPFDPAVGLAGISRATLLMLDGQRDAADEAMTQTLQAWVAGSGTTAAPEPGTLADDVMAIRDAVFDPLGGTAFINREPHWNGFQWPAALPRFVLLPRQVQVKEADREASIAVDVARPPRALSNVLFADTTDQEYLTDFVSRAGGTRRREPAGVMEVPNQPIGGAMAILQWWNGFFPTRPGHWSGVEMLTYPALTTIEFTNAARTRALVPVVIGYGGATLVMEKVDGVWTITALVNQWVT